MQTFLNNYADGVKEKFSFLGDAQPEDQLKPLVCDLLESSGAHFNQNVTTHTEVRVSEHNIRPDIGVAIGNLNCGYIELKAPEHNADPTRSRSKHDKDQWNKLKCLPNLIYTNGIEWRLYRSGIQPHDRATVRFGSNLIESGKKAISTENVRAIEGLFRDFLNWKPTAPTNPESLAALVAPLASLLKSEVEEALQNPSSVLIQLAKEWREYLSPNFTNSRFADAYAQTVTYSLLLARLSGAEKLDPRVAAESLGENNSLLAGALGILGNQEAQVELKMSFDQLQRLLEALKLEKFQNTKADLWLYFYENFLAAYDPKLRKEYGVYFTPREVVKLQVNLASELLETHFGKPLGFADDGVTFIDPAVGTGTYLLESINQGLEKVQARFGSENVPTRANQLAKNALGFEKLVGPYAVAKLRLTQTIESAINKNKSPNEGKSKLDHKLRIFLTDTLESPNQEPIGLLPFFYKPLTKELQEARDIKNKTDILVCIGNPPYLRHQSGTGGSNSKMNGGWIRYGDGVPQKTQTDLPILEDFLEPARERGAGVHLKNLYNDYVYFWRWAMWKLYEKQKQGGIVTFITPSSYLAGPGFIGMREYMRRTFDEFWVIDLEGNNLGPRKSANVFNIQIPVAIGIGVRGGRESPDVPAVVKYTKIVANTKEEKLSKISQYSKFDEIDWQLCPDDWYSPFLPVGASKFFDWPKLDGIFPWNSPGIQFKRTWPIGETKELLETRWTRFCTSNLKSRSKLLKETGYRNIDTKVNDIFGNPIETLIQCTPQSSTPPITRYGYRFLDQQHAIIDNRLADRIRPTLMQVHSKTNFYLVSMNSMSPDVGPAITVADGLPDLHYMWAGGKDIIPVYRDSECTESNISSGLLTALEEHFGKQITDMELVSYVYGVLGGQSYTKTFWGELSIPGARVPITKNIELFKRASTLGEKLIWLHTYGKQFSDNQGAEIPKGNAELTRAIPYQADSYPSEFNYDQTKQEIFIGSGVISKVVPEVWQYSVSNTKIIDSWLGYRMKKRRGKKSSPLDDIRPQQWAPNMTEELLSLIWIIEETLKLDKKLESVLAEIISGPCFNESELPVPSVHESEPPSIDRQRIDPKNFEFE